MTQLKTAKPGATAPDKTGTATLAASSQKTENKTGKLISLLKREGGAALTEIKFAAETDAKIRPLVRQSTASLGMD